MISSSIFQITICNDVAFRGIYYAIVFNFKSRTSSIMRSVCLKVFIVYFNYCTQSMILPQAVCFFPRKDLETRIADLLSKQILTATGEREELLSSYFNQVWKNFVHVMSISP